MVRRRGQPSGILKAALAGFGITLLLYLLPLVHFLTVWVSPLIGGFLSGSMAQRSLTSGVVLGLTMGGFMALTIASLGSLIFLIVSAFLPNQGLIPMDMGTLFLIGLVPVVHTVVLGTVGAAIGGALSRKRVAQTADLSLV